MQKYLIVTADDFGLHRSVNEAVERSSRAGILTAASLMVGAPAAADAIVRARRLPQLRVGLHLVLADGRATLAPALIPGLVDPEGRMNGRMFLNSVRFFASPALRRQLEAEIRAQFSAYARTGLKLDHVNVHKHFHLHPTLLDMLLKIGRDFGMQAVRVPDEPLWFSARSGGLPAGLQTVLLRPWLALMRRRLRREHLVHNDHLFGVAASGHMDEATLLMILARLPEGVTEIYLHPAVHSGRAIAPTMPDYRHADELAALLSPRVGAAIAAGGFGRGGYGDLERVR